MLMIRISIDSQIIPGLRPDDQPPLRREIRNHYSAPANASAPDAKPEGQPVGSTGVSRTGDDPRGERGRGAGYRPNDAARSNPRDERGLGRR